MGAIAAGTQDRDSPAIVEPRDGAKELKLARLYTATSGGCSSLRKPVAARGGGGGQVDLIPPVTASFLILHGAGDTAADGGSPFQTPDRARHFEAALRDAGKQVRAVYYEGAGHNGIFSNSEQFEAVIAETASLVMRLARDRRRSSAHTCQRGDHRREIVA
jgi:acetyl esterase/lipase